MAPDLVGKARLIKLVSMTPVIHQEFLKKDVNNFKVVFSDKIQH